MNARRRDVRFVGLIGLTQILSVALLPAVAEADDLYLTPSIAVIGVYDDNLFLEANNPQSGAFWRITPALAAGYDAGSLSLNGYYSQDAEFYAEYPELEDNAVRRQALFGIDYDPTVRLSLSLQGEYASTFTPGQLAPNVGLQLGRVYAESISVNPSMSYEFNKVTTGTAGFSYNSYEVFDGPEIDVGITTLGVMREVSKTDTLGANLIFSAYEFGDSGPSSKALTLSWNHTQSPRASFSVAAGPRYFGDMVAPEISASAQYALETADITLSYVRSQTALLGQSEPVNTEYLVISFDYSPNQRLNVQISPSYAQNWNANTTTDIYTMNIDISYRINRYVSAIGSYQYNRQNGSFDIPTPLTITENVISVGVVFSLPDERTGEFMKTNTPMPEPVSRRSIQ